MLSEHVPSLVGILPVQSAMAHILYILQGCGLFLYLFTGFTRAFGRISRGSHFYVLLKEYVITKMNKTMMKIGRFAITIMALMTAVSVSAQDFDKKNLLYRVSSAENKTVELVGFEKKPKEELLIPDEVSYKGDKYIITSIAENAFKDCENLKSVIGSTIQQIKDGAFQGCINLSSATFTDQLSEVKNNAFQGCTSLSQVSLGNNVQTIGDAAFQNCSSLTEFSFGSGLKSLGKGVINGTKISSIVLPNSLVKIGHHAFADCNQLSSVTFGNALTHIENNAFEKTSISTIVFPNTLLKIGDKAFADCTKLHGITFGNSLEMIGPNAFEGTNLTTLLLPNSLIEIADGAFRDCTKLQSISFGSRLKKIGIASFAKTDLSKIDFPNSLLTIGSKAFEECKRLQSISLGTAINNIEEKAFSNCSMLTADFSDIQCEIANNAFEGCKDVKVADYSLKGLARFLKNNTGGRFVIQNESFLLWVIEGQGVKRFINKKGKIISETPSNLADREYLLTEVSKGDGYKYALLDREGEVILNNITSYEEAVDMWEKDEVFKEGLLPIRKEDEFGYIDKTGKIVIPCSFEYAEEFNEGIAWVSKGYKKWGCIDKNGQIVVPFIYDKGEFHEGLAMIYKESNRKILCGYIDKSGNIVIPCIYDYGDHFNCGVARVSKDNKWFYIDKQGKQVEGLLPYSSEDLDFHEGCAIIENKEGKYGFLNTQGRIIIPCVYDEVKDYNDGLAWVCKDSQWGCIDILGNIVVPFVYSNCRDFKENLAAVENDGKYGYIDKKGVVVIPFIYSYADDFIGGIARVSKNGKIGIVDKKGRSTFDYQK